MSVAVPAVIALLLDPSSQPAVELAAGFEEEGVPLVLHAGTGAPSDLARRAAELSALGHGIGADRHVIALTLAVRPRTPYLEAPASQARAFGHAAARLVAGRPLRLGSID